MNKAIIGRMPLFLAQACFLVGFLSKLSGCVQNNKCEFYASSVLSRDKFEVMEGLYNAGRLSDDHKYIDCYPEFAQCAVLWSFDISSNETDVLFKGCWKGNAECSRNACIATDNINSPHLNSSRFCCCSEPLCNANFSFVYVPKPIALPKFPIFSAGLGDGNAKTYFILAVSLSLCFLALVGSYSSFRVWSWRQQKLAKLQETAKQQDNAESALLLESDECLNSSSSYLDGKKFDFNQLRLESIIDHGRYGTVWRAVYPTADDKLQPFAVKILDWNNRSSFCNETAVYKLPLMEHDSLLRYYGSFEKCSALDESNLSQSHQDASANTSSILTTAESIALAAGLIAFDPKNSPATSITMLKRECWLITNFVSGGTLRDFLKANCVSWEQLCLIGQSIAAGLAHLHAEIKDTSSGAFKPAIVHRDINSRNILMKSDRCGVICDLGFALPLNTANHSTSGGCETSEMALAEVGTLRYLAPEVLEGAVNLRDAQNALKQVDIYALGLTMWEILSRCIDVYHLTGHDVPEYQAPYSKEIDPQPTLEQMQEYVAKRKVRPAFPPAFYRKYSTLGLRSARSLIDDCWDADSEARLSAPCVQERLASLILTRPASLGLSHARTTSPNVADYINVYRNGQTQHWPLIGNDSTATSSGIESMGSHSLGSSSYHAGVEAVPLQAYQGLNPCLERNIHQESDESGIDTVAESSFPANKVDPCVLISNAVFSLPTVTAVNGSATGACNRTLRSFSLVDSVGCEGLSLPLNSADPSSLASATFDPSASRGVNGLTSERLTAGSSAPNSARSSTAGGPSLVRSARDHLFALFGRNGGGGPPNSTDATATPILATAKETPRSSSAPKHSLQHPHEERPSISVVNATGARKQSAPTNSNVSSKQQFNVRNGMAAMKPLNSAAPNPPSDFEAVVARPRIQSEC